MPAKSSIRKFSGTHGHSSGGKTTKTYKAWSSMKNRCDNPNNPAYPNYGMRGIKYCERWRMFENFLEDMGEVPDDLELERVNNELGYSKENCKWESFEKQNLNKRNSVRITINGITKNASVWCRENGIPTSTFYNRKRRGWTDERAIFEKPEIQPRLLTLNGKTQSMSAWARELGVWPMAIHNRLGIMSVEKALTTPFLKRS